MLRRLVEQSGRPMTFSFMQRPADPDGWRTVFKALEKAGKDHLPLRAQGDAGSPVRPVAIGTPAQ